MVESTSNQDPRSPSSPSEHAALEELFAAQRAKRIQTPVLSFCLLLVVAVFLSATYRTIQRNFAMEDVQQEARRAAESLIQDATPMFVSVLRETAPVYQREASTALQEMAPKLADRTKHELEVGLEEVSLRTHATLEGIAANCMANLVGGDPGELPEGFDYLLTEEGQAQCEALMMTEMTDLLGELDGQYRTPTERLIDAMEKLAPESSDLSYEDLQRRFVHLWLVLIDTEVTEGTSLEPMTIGTPSSAQ